MSSQLADRLVRQAALGSAETLVSDFGRVGQCPRFTREECSIGISIRSGWNMELTSRADMVGAGILFGKTTGLKQGSGSWLNQSASIPCQHGRPHNLEIHMQEQGRENQVGR